MDKNHNNFKDNLTEINLIDLFHILKKRKKTILLFTVIAVSLAIAYNYLATPYFESTITLKKELPDNRRSIDEFKEVFLMQTSDDLNSEIESIKSPIVLEGVIEELQLYFEISRIEFHNYTNEINKTSYDYNKINKNDGFPAISDIDFDLNSHSIAGEYTIEIVNPITFKIEKIKTSDVPGYDDNEKAPFNKNVKRSPGKIQLDGFSFKLHWPEARVGDKIFFKIRYVASLIQELQENIKVSKLGDTNLFKVSYQSPSPYHAKQIVETIVENFRDSRLVQKRRMVNYSYEFVDNQLQSIYTKLDSVEDSLSTFKSKNKILDLDSNSDEYITYLNNLETKKMETEIELNEYRSKVNDMEKEQQGAGYIDQTYLVPNKSERGSSPFSVLLEQLSNAEIKKLEMLQRRKANHPDVLIIDNQIEQIKRKLAEFNKNTINSYRIIINSLEKKRNDLIRYIRKYSLKIEDLPSKESTLAKLIRNKKFFEKVINMLLNKREELRMAELSKLQDIFVVGTARLPMQPIAPSKNLNLFLGLILGTLLGIFTVFVQEFFDKKIKDIDELKLLINSSVIGVLPQLDKEVKKEIDEADTVKHKLMVLRDDRTGAKESFNLQKHKIFAALKGSNNIFLVTSCDENDGKTTVASNLAISIAKAGKKVILIDGDLKKAQLSNLFNIPDDFPGVIQSLNGRKSNLPNTYNPFKEDPENKMNFQILPSGGICENSDEIFDSPKMKKLLKDLQMKYDYVILDTPPITRTIDLYVLGKFVKDIVLVVRSNKTLKKHLLYVQEELDQMNINILGVVFNDYSSDNQNYIYNYGYYGKKEYS